MGFSMKKIVLILMFGIFGFTTNSIANDTKCGHCKKTTSDSELRECLKQCKASSEPTYQTLQIVKDNAIIAKEKGWTIEYKWDDMQDILIEGFALKKPKDAPFGGDGTYPMLGFTTRIAGFTEWYILLGDITLKKQSNYASTTSIMKIDNTDAFSVHMSPTNFFPSESDTTIKNSYTERGFYKGFVDLSTSDMSGRRKEFRNAKKITIRIPTEEFGDIDVTWDLDGFTEVDNILYPENPKKLIKALEADNSGVIMFPNGKVRGVHR